VIYDSDCGFCKWCLAVVLTLDRAGGALRPLPLGTAEADRLLADVAAEERSASWHLVIDSGDRRVATAEEAPESARVSAGAALPPALRLLRGGRIPAAALSRMPGVTERSYRWVAAHRVLLGRFVSARMRRWAERVIAAHGQAGT
jgi:predicted DCC family thiol-disulfide oxidoreductase YuxK